MLKNNAEGAGLLGRLRVAAPCPASWDAMEGDERVRFCRLCRLNVYNFSEMTEAEVVSLVARAEGRLCGRRYRRADGTVLTKDCPVGLAALRRRAGRAAAAAFAALASLWSAAAGQSPTPQRGQGAEATLSCKGGAKLKIKRAAAAPGEEPALRGVARDPLGAFIPGARVALRNRATKGALAAVTDDQGAFSFARPAPGTYTLTLEMAGFAPQEVKGLVIEAGESLSVEFELSLSEVEVMVGVVADEPFSSEGNKRVISGDTILKLPIPR